MECAERVLPVPLGQRPHERLRPRARRNRLRALDRCIPCQQFAFTPCVLPVDSKARTTRVLDCERALRQEPTDPLLFRKRIGILPLRTSLRNEVNRVGIPLRDHPLVFRVVARHRKPALKDVAACDEHDARIVLRSLPTVDPHELALLVDVMSRENTHDLVRTRNRAKVHQRGGESGRVPVVRLLLRTIRIHHEEGLLQTCTTVVVLVARIEDAPVGKFPRMRRAAAVYREAADVGAVRAANIEVDVLRLVAGDRLLAA